MGAKNSKKRGVNAKEHVQYALMMMNKDPHKDHGDITNTPISNDLSFVKINPLSPYFENEKKRHRRILFSLNEDWEEVTRARVNSRDVAEKYCFA